jgi:hypothetical protein
MRALAIGSLISLTFALPALAALPPQWQRQKELLAIIEDSAVTDAFGFDGIEAIEWVEPDHYQVRGGACTLDITIEDLPDTQGEGWAGPRQFRIVLGEPRCQ